MQGSKTGVESTIAGKSPTKGGVCVLPDNNRRTILKMHTQAEAATRRHLSLHVTILVAANHKAVKDSVNKVTRTGANFKKERTRACCSNSYPQSGRTPHPTYQPSGSGGIIDENDSNAQSHCVFLTKRLGLSITLRVSCQKHSQGWHTLLDDSSPVLRQNKLGWIVLQETFSFRKFSHVMVMQARGEVTSSRDASERVWKKVSSAFSVFYDSPQKRNDHMLLSPRHVLIRIGIHPTVHSLAANERTNKQK